MGLKIATWNVERLKHYRDIDKITSEIKDIDADILVLTETDTRLMPSYPYFYSTLLLKDKMYRATENRVTVFSKYKAVRLFDPCDPSTSICPVFETEYGVLAVYGKIIGIYGNRKPPFKEQIKSQTEDIKRIAQTYSNICVSGDYNLSFGDNYYFTEFGRNMVERIFSECGIEILTKAVPECADHIAVSGKFIHNKPEITEWNMDKALSDHKGIAVEL